MPGHANANVAPIDDLADQFKNFNQRITSLERAASGPAPPPTGFVLKTGDTMTGLLTITNPTSAGQNNLALGDPAGTGGEGGQLQLTGAAGQATWLVDNYTGSLRFITAGTVAMQIPAGSDVMINRTLNMMGNNVGPYWGDWGGGLYMIDATWIRVWNNKGFYTSGEIRGGSLSCESSINMMSAGLYLRLVGPGDNNHKLFYTSATPTSSGEASNGPRLDGYSSVWLHTVNTNKDFYLSSGGSVFISSGAGYLNFSSRELKENIVALDPFDCLDHVRRWHPVEFDYLDDEDGNAPGQRHGEGFISEDHVVVTPTMVNVTDDGWANAINYANAVPRLTGAIQALLARVEQLEPKENA